jgi:hypothetical protein
MSPPVYLHVEPGAELPQLAAQPSRFVIVADVPCDVQWQSRVSEWLIHAGCLYMMAWGANCGSWDTSVDEANLEAFGYGDIPDDRFVMTTWHERESLSDAFWFAKHNAYHPAVALERTVILHIADRENGDELLRAFAEA